MAKIKSSGSTEAIRDWLNASLYNKEEIDDLFIQNNQAGLIPYDLTITGDQPEQLIKLVGQTSGKTYNICLGGLVGYMYKKTLLYDNNGNPAPTSTNINYLQNISDFDQLMIIFSTVNDEDLSNYFSLSFVDVDLLLELPAFNCASFFKRYFVITSTETTFNYTSYGLDETSGYDPRIYRIYGIKY